MPKKDQSTPVPAAATAVAGAAAAAGSAATTGSSARWWVLAAIGIGTFMSALDTSVGTAIQPLLRSTLHSTVATTEWVITVYLLVVSGLLLGMGRLGDMVGQKKIYLLGFLIFVGASVACGVSHTIELLIFSRALQAIGAAMLYASGPAIITQNFPPEQRGTALGIQLTMTYLGLTLGPVAGGWLAQNFGWGSVFFINVPVGIPAVWISMRYIPVEVPKGAGRKFDLVGGVLFLVGLVSLLYALNNAYRWGWTSVLTLVMLAASLAVLVIFYVVETRTADPMLDLSLIRNRLFSFAAVSAMLNYMGLYTTLFLIPYYLGDGRGFNTANVGKVLSAQPLSMAVISFVAGALSDKIGTRWPTTVGMAVLAVGLFILAQLGPHSPISQVVLGLVLAGLGTGMFVSPNNSAMLGVAPRERRGIASGLMATARNVGMVLGLGMAGAIFTSIHGSGEHGGASDSLFNAIHSGFLGGGIVALIGMVTSFVRER